MSMKRIKFGQGEPQYKRTPKFDQRKKGVEIQTYGLTQANEVVHCGPHWVPEISARWLYKLHRNWLRWRRWYDNLPENRKRNYPAKINPPIAFFAAHPIDNPPCSTWIRVTANP